ncbi:MAG: orotate phosphoribosyltransferase, partial [Rhodospirillaceae bacterium]|nr:orotate phosphoribosyltransferase [Rhodospirillaceae bacterium]
ASDESVDYSDPRLSRLRAMIAEKSVLRGQFRLASGGESGLFFDMKQTLLLPEGLSLVGSLMLEKVLESRATAVGGLVLGACPIVGAIAQASYAMSASGGGREIAAFYVRKEPKHTGTRELIEGHDIAGHKAVMMIEDVTTKGGSVIRAIEAVRRETQCEVLGVLTVVDREQGARAALAEIGLPLDALFTISEFDA